VFLSAGIFITQEIHSGMKIKHGLFIVLIFITCLLLDYRYIHTAHIFTKQSLVPIKPVHWNHEQPIWVNQGHIDKSDDIKQHVVIQEGEGTAEVVAWKSAERVVTVTARKPLALSIGTFYFPGWKAYVDGVPTKIKIEKNVGTMLINIPKGTHTVLVKFEDTPVRYYSKVISLVSLLSLIVLLFIKKKAIKDDKNRFVF
jgi:hypothetical protein